MIDLSHLTEEEQGVILTVLRRDAELKKAEEERIRKLEKVSTSTSESDGKLKYLTGEWFYEAKSRRHMDKIHGSEIILASMKQRKAAGLDGSLRIERSKGRGSDIAGPPKPARCFEALQPQEINVIYEPASPKSSRLCFKAAYTSVDAEKENLNSAVRSPRMRHNPFNRASLVVVEPPENNNDVMTSRDWEPSETEAISPLKNHPAGDAAQTSGASVTSDCSSIGFKPVPKKRTFLSRRHCSQSESNSLGLDAQQGSAGIVPTPRRSLQHASSGSSTQDCLNSQNEMPQKNAVPVSNQVSKSAQSSNSANETSQQPLCSVSQVSSNSRLERNPASIPRDRSVTYMSANVSPEREAPQKSDERDNQTQRQHAGVNNIILHTDSIQTDSGRVHSSSVGPTARQEELSLTQSTVDPDTPISYYLNFIDKSDQQAQKKSNQKHAFRLSTQMTSPPGDEEESIAKVLDWFSRSTDSNDWLSTEDGPEATNSSDKHVENSKVRREDSVRKDTEDFISDRKKESLEIKGSSPQRQSYEFRAIERTGNKELTEAQEEAQKDTRERIQLQEVKDNDSESQPPKISHLKSFWEKSYMGPKILVSKSKTPSDKGQKRIYLPGEEEEEDVNKPHLLSDTPLGICSGRGIHDKCASNDGDERGQRWVTSPQKDTGDNLRLSHERQVDIADTDTLSHKSNNDQTHNSDYYYEELLTSSKAADRTYPDTEILCVTRLSPHPKTAVQPRPGSESIPSVKPNPALESISHSRETPLQEELSKMMSVSQLEFYVQTRDNQDSDKLYFSRNSPYMDYKPSGNDAQVTSKMQLSKRRNSDDKSISNKDRANGSTSNRVKPHQENTAERIKQLKSFWEKERNKPMFYSGKPKTAGEGKVAHGANQAKLNKRFTKSEYDLRSIGNDSGSEEDSDRNHHNFTILPLNQRLEKSPSSLSTSRTQFNTLREFWDEALSDTKGTFSFDKPKGAKRKEPVCAQFPPQELKGGDPESFRLSSVVEKTRPVATKLSLSPQNRSKSPHDRQMGSGSRAMNDNKSSLSNYMTAEPRKSAKDSGREEKSNKTPSSSGKEIRPPKNRKDSFSSSSSRGSSMRRTTSMFALSVSDEKDQGKLKMDVSPVHSKSRRQRQNAEDSETVTPRARAFVPRDYRHYLGMTDKTSVHTSLAPALKNEGSSSKCGYEFDLSGPVRASTPVSSEDRYGRKGSKSSQRPLWANHSSSDTGQESSVSSTSETWSNTRNSSNRENDDEDQSLVRKALRRAEARPKNLAKSMEDITASLSPRQERRQDPTSDLRRSSHVSSIPSPSSSLFSDPDHLKKMSKSVPSFLQKEDAGRDTDSTSEDSYHRGSLMTGRSITNLSNSSGMASSLSGSVMTMYSGDFGNVEVQGNIQFSINYVQRLREFHIFVAECRDLAAFDPKRSRSDPYVKSYLVPDKANLGKRKTSVKKKTLNPTFNEILRYRVRMEYLRTQTLILSVWHHDTFGRNSFLGEVDVDLSKWDFDHTQMNDLALKARTTSTQVLSNGQGEMRLAIRFLPQIVHSEGLTKDSPNTGEVHIWVKDCKNLPPIRATIDPYVKCFMLPDTSRKSRQKTRVLRRTVDPVFNHTMVYDGIREVDLTEACVELTVWDRDRLASNLLGGLRLGAGTGRSYGAVVDWMDSTPYEVALWERMMATPNEWVEGVLPLRMLNSAKTTFK